jgi:hypothetical protein
MMSCAVCTVHMEMRSTDFLVEPQNRQVQFNDLGLKIIVTVSWFEPQNQAGYGFSVASQNRREDNLTWDTCRDLAACFTCKQVVLGFRSLVSRLIEARRWVVHVASSRRLHRVETEDGRVDATECIRPFYPKITVFYVLDPRGNLVF